MTTYQLPYTLMGWTENIQDEMPPQSLDEFPSQHKPEKSYNHWYTV